MENKVEHLKMIQDVIKRMASNSFAMKGWATAIITGLFILDSKANGLYFYLIALFPVVMFWFLDSYYLRQERLFITLYDDVRTSSEDFQFSMKLKSEYLGNSKNKFSNCFWSKTEVWFYIPLIAFILIVVFIKNYPIHHLCFCRFMRF